MSCIKHMTDGACHECKIELLEKELATLKASLPKIKADAVLNYAKNMERVEQAANLKMEQGLRMMASFAKKTAEEYANKLEAGE